MRFVINAQRGETILHAPPFQQLRLDLYEVMRRYWDTIEHDQVKAVARRELDAAGGGEAEHRKCDKGGESPSAERDEHQ